jgi:hypothetical protein
MWTCWAFTVVADRFAGLLILLYAQKLNVITRVRAVIPPCNDSLSATVRDAVIDALLAPADHADPEMETKEW